MSVMRKRYIRRLVGRCLIFILCALLGGFYPESFAILDRMNFWKSFSPLHLL